MIKYFFLPWVVYSAAMRGFRNRSVKKKKTKNDSRSKTKSDVASEAQPLPTGCAMEHPGAARSKGMYAV